MGQSEGMSTNADRLAERVRARRAQLDMSQLDVWQAGGPSNTTLTEIENGRLENLTRTTARRLDQGLEWEPGSARRVWEGGEPSPRKVTGELDELVDRIRSADFLTAEQKAEVLSALAAPAEHNIAERGSA